MSKHVELPLVSPLYQTYHYQGPGTAIAVNNPTIRNWYLNQIMNLKCNRKFLSGYTTPEITIEDSEWTANPYLEMKWISTQFTKGYINPIIRELLNNGYYVAFTGVDDFYVKGKSWYKERHFNHNGLICGYDQNDKTYCIYAYDSNWKYQKFWTPQKAFNSGRTAMNKKGFYGIVCGLKAMENKIDFCPSLVCDKLEKYLDSSLEKYPFNGEGDVFGIVVHEYIAEYVSKLFSGDIPYERMDRRIFRLIWEHKKAMHERLILIEQCLKMNTVISEKYKSLVEEAETMRMLYASHHMKRRDSVLPIVRKKLLTLTSTEREILTLLVEKARKEL